jgi:hypothetical protein
MVPRDWIAVDAAYMRTHRAMRASLALIIAAAASGACLAEPPKILHTIPAHHTKDVDPSTNTVTVEFDQDMDTTGYSWTKFGPGFPETAGKPQWKGLRTCVLTVKLEAGRVYTLGVNSTTLRGFRNKSGEAATPYVLTFRTKVGNDPPAELLDPKKNEEAVKQLREAIDQKYSYRDLRKLDWVKQFARYEAALREAWTTDEFTSIVASLLAAAQDEHISIQNGGVGLMAWNGRVVENYSRQSLPKFVPGWKQVNPAVATGKFEDGIGYLLISTWTREARTGGLTAIKEFADAKGLIIDVRPNAGGDERDALQIAACFATKPQVYAKSITRDLSLPGGFTQPVSRTVWPNPFGPQFQGRVAVLIGPMNVSSNESFILMMRQTPNAKLIGQRTSGSSGNPQPVKLANGVTVRLPSWQALFPDGTLLEGKGIEPDITVPTKPADFKDRDPVIERALEWVRVNKEEQQ